MESRNKTGPESVAEIELRTRTVSFSRPLEGERLQNLFRRRLELVLISLSHFKGTKDRLGTTFTT